MTVPLRDLTTEALANELTELAGQIRQLAEPLTAEQLWRKPVPSGNSIGHLILHLTGNLNHFVGAQLGQTAYVRDREREFTERNPPDKVEALGRLDEAVALFGKVVRKLDSDRLVQLHPDAQRGTVIQVLIHLVAHFALHRGQMSYLARLVASSPSKP
jgi:uncharacterized damage-inducible protein DinB